MTGRRGVPDPEALRSLRHAPDVDPVLGAAGGSPQERAVRGQPVPEVVSGPVGVRKEKASFTAPAEELARIRAAYLNTHVAEGHRSWAEFVTAALGREARRLEALHHDGLPWPPVAAGRIPTGRPFGS